MINQTKKKISHQHQKRLQQISEMLREIRFSEGLNQNELIDYGISRRQVQRVEHSNNLTLLGLFRILDFYGYTLSEFFADIE